MRRFAQWINIRSALIYLLAFTILAGFLAWHIDTSPPTLIKGEVAAAHSSSSLSQIKDNPLYAPHKLVQFGFAHFKNSDLALRLPSVLFALIFIWCFFSITRRWFGRTAAIFGTAIFATVPWLFLSARSAEPRVLLLAPLAIMASILWCRQAENKSTIAFAVTITTGLAVYIPGMTFLLILIVGFWRARLWQDILEIRKSIRLVCLFLLLLLIAPLVFAIVRDTTIIGQLLLVPDHWQGPISTLNSIGWSATSLVWRAPYRVQESLGRLPVLNATALVLSLFGGFIMWQRARKELYLLLAMIIGAIILSGLNQNLLLLNLALPSLGILLVAGVRYLYGEWKSVFPLNPLPRALAVALISVLIALNLLICLRYGLHAWPHSLSSPNGTSVIQ